MKYGAWYVPEISASFSLSSIAHVYFVFLPLCVCESFKRFGRFKTMEAVLGPASGLVETCLKVQPQGTCTNSKSDMQGKGSATSKPISCIGRDPIEWLRESQYFPVEDSWNSIAKYKMSYSSTNHKREWRKCFCLFIGFYFLDVIVQILILYLIG
jgi:hypothetical protein